MSLYDRPSRFTKSVIVPMGRPSYLHSEALEGICGKIREMVSNENYPALRFVKELIWDQLEAHDLHFTPSKNYFQSTLSTICGSGFKIRAASSLLQHVSSAFQSSNVNWLILRSFVKTGLEISVGDGNIDKVSIDEAVVLEGGDIHRGQVNERACGEKISLALHAVMDSNLTRKTGLPINRLGVLLVL